MMEGRDRMWYYSKICSGGGGFMRNGVILKDAAEAVCLEPGARLFRPGTGTRLKVS